MKKEFTLAVCPKCGAMVEIIKECTCEDCGIKCCGETMVEVRANTVDASVEKHMPTYEVVGNYVVVTVPHVMEEEHYIEWVGIDGDNINAKKYFHAGENCKAVFPYIAGSKLLAYCNKHGLWSCEVK